VSPETAQELQKARQRAEQKLLAIEQQIRAKHSNCDTYFQCGQPPELIVAAARNLESDLIVISTHDYRWLRHLLCGSDAEAILRHAPCPVLVVHEHERDFVVP
jgi:nucleotide-binding universal stress UspA family protein